MLERTKAGNFLPSRLNEVCQMDRWAKKLQPLGIEWSGPASLWQVTQGKDRGKDFIVKTFDFFRDLMSSEMWIAERRAYERIDQNREKSPEWAQDIVGYYGYVKCSEKEQYLFLEWVGNVSLRRALPKIPYRCPGKRWQEFWVGLLYYLACIVEFLEGIGINHRDLHTSNIHVKNGRLKVFDFGLSVGEKKKNDPPWSVTDWGGNFMGEFVTSKFILGFDLHDFLASFFIEEDSKKLVPQEILRNLMFPFLKNLSLEEQKKLDALEFDDPPYFQVTFEGKTKVVPYNLGKTWKPTSGKVYAQTVREYFRKMKR